MIARSIPACAGEPQDHAGCANRVKVDPRVCGGARYGQWTTISRGGRSPRVRGSPSPRFLCVFTARSIPACAGEPGGVMRIDRVEEVDPRVCGGARRAFSRGWVRYGRSPRVRGSPVLRSRLPCCPRSIPACAGEPISSISSSVSISVDPRVCGGAAKRANCQSPAQGRSPRVRGSLVITSAPCSSSGSIPACAGEPVAYRHDRDRNRVDPRVCGGAAAWQNKQQSNGGRSPRVRGSPIRAELRGKDERSIPACAGEPCLRRGAAGDTTVDPRVCGGAWTRSTRHVGMSGRSPRVRGSPTWAASCRIVSGSIPACAGEPMEAF